jgi:hypothetical protein
MLSPGMVFFALQPLRGSLSIKRDSSQIILDVYHRVLRYTGGLAVGDRREGDGYRGLLLQLRQGRAIHPVRSSISSIHWTQYMIPKRLSGRNSVWES